MLEIIIGILPTLLFWVGGPCLNVGRGSNPFFNLFFILKTEDHKANTKVNQEPRKMPISRASRSPRMRNTATKGVSGLSFNGIMSNFIDCALVFGK